MDPRLRVISLGAGVQSTTLALLAKHGELPTPDAAIFADTQSEPQAVYDHLRWLQTEANLPFPIHIVTVGSLYADIMRGTNSTQTGRRRERWASIPYFLAQPDGQQGLGRRQCTREYKIDPLAKEQRRLLGYRPRQRMPDGVCEVWLGITTDEAHRMKPSRFNWQTARWPLIELRMSRGDCIAWMERHGYARPPKSACAFCPYQSDERWQAMKQNDPTGWAMAVEADHAIRAAKDSLKLRNVPYLHRSMKPLDQVDFAEWDGARQPDLFGNECEGMCGV